MWDEVVDYCKKTGNNVSLTCEHYGTLFVELPVHILA